MGGGVAKIGTEKCSEIDRGGGARTLGWDCREHTSVAARGGVNFTHALLAPGAGPRAPAAHPRPDCPWLAATAARRRLPPVGSPTHPHPSPPFPALQVGLLLLVGLVQVLAVTGFFKPGMMSKACV